MDLYLEQYLVDLSNHAVNVYHCFSDDEVFEWENEFVKVLHKENVDSVSEFLKSLSLSDEHLSKIIAEAIISDCKKVIESDEHKNYHDTALNLHEIVSNMHEDFFSTLLSEKWEKCEKSKLMKVKAAHGLIQNISKKKKDFIRDKTDQKIIQHLKNLIEHSVDLHHDTNEDLVIFHKAIILDPWSHTHIVDFLEAFWEENPHAASIVAQELKEICIGVIGRESHDEHHDNAHRMHWLVSKIHDKYFLALEYNPWEKSQKARNDTLNLAHGILERVFRRKAYNKLS